jgi:hypothetical protein
VTPERIVLLCLGLSVLSSVVSFAVGVRIGRLWPHRRDATPEVRP